MDKQTAINRIILELQLVMALTADEETAVYNALSMAYSEGRISALEEGVAGMKELQEQVNTLIEMVKP